MAESKSPTRKAQHKKTKKPNVSETKPSRKEQYKLVIGFILIAFSIYLLFSFGSFLFNAEADQSKLQMNWWKLIKDPEIKVENVTGKTGAWLADVFINRWFGISSFLFIYMISLFGLQF